MKFSSNFTKTSKQNASNETSKNAQLLIRAGFVHKTMSGVYAFLPLGLKVLNRIEAIIKKHLNSIGGQEVLLNNLHPKELWVKADNRWETLDILFQVPSRTGDQYALAQSNEEQMAEIAKDYITSWKDLPKYDAEKNQFPLSVYQINTKFRDELRSKAGLMRGREFRMKDMYDFHTNEESQNSYYDLVLETYLKIYKELGLEAYSVRASGGAFSKYSHEFQVIADAGEDKLVKWSDGTKDNVEISKGYPTDTHSVSTGDLQIRQDLGEDVKSVSDHAKAANSTESRIFKTVIFKASPIKKQSEGVNETDEKLIGVCIRGDLKVNEELVYKALEELEIENIVLSEADSLDLENIGTSRGRATSLKIRAKDYKKPIIWLYDKSIESGKGLYSAQYSNVDVQRDCVTPNYVGCLNVVQQGFVSEEDSSVIAEEIVNSSEVGNIFKLGKKWTKKEVSNVTFADVNNTINHPLMSCYGIGTTRCMGVIAEVCNDEKGLKWPASVSPFNFHLITNLTKDDEIINLQITKLANKIYNGELKVMQNKEGKWKLIDPTNIEDITYFTFEEIENLSSKNEILWDDRHGINMGQKFADADLIGIPYQIVITKRTIETGDLIEVKKRN